jgi:hypothetical protein
MAYRCPVCDDLQPDGEHLANHLAITTMLDRTDHADWLEEHAPSYGDMGPAELAEAITPHVESVDGDDDQAGETVQVDGASQPGEAPPFEHVLRRQSGPGRTRERDPEREVDADTRAILQEARELTAAMRGEEREDTAGEQNDGGEVLPEEATGNGEATGAEESGGSS